MSSSCSQVGPNQQHFHPWKAPCFDPYSLKVETAKMSEVQEHPALQKCFSLHQFSMFSDLMWSYKYSQKYIKAIRELEFYLSSHSMSINAREILAV